MKVGDRRIVGGKHAKRHNYHKLVGKEVELEGCYYSVKDAWFVRQVMPNGKLNENTWYVIEEDLLHQNNESSLIQLKGEIQV